MPISSSAGTSMAKAAVCIQTDRPGQRRQEGSARCDQHRENISVKRKCALYYPWLIERISQTFFQEWVGAYIVPTKIDHADWLCTSCGEYTATWETRSGSYCKYCWSLERTSPLQGPTYMLEMIPLD